MSAAAQAGIRQSIPQVGTMKIASWNVNGIRAVIRKGVFAPYVAEHLPDVLCLQETKARQDQVKPDLPGYHEFWCSADKAGYSGTAIFSRIEPLGILTGMPERIVADHGLADDLYGDPNREGRSIAAEFDGLWVVSVYTPNSKGDLSRLPLRYDRWDPAFLAYVRELEAGRHGTGTPKPVVFCGDLNVAHREIDLARPKEARGTHGFTDEERERFQDYLDHGFVDTFRHLHPDVTEAYSWWNMVTRARERNVGWRIDYLLASASLAPHIAEAAIHPDVVGSDHCPVSVTLNLD